MIKYFFKKRTPFPEILEVARENESPANTSPPTKISK